MRKLKDNFRKESIEKRNKIAGKNEKIKRRSSISSPAQTQSEIEQQEKRR